MDFLQIRCQQKCSRATEGRGLDPKAVTILTELGSERFQGKMECHKQGTRARRWGAVPGQGAQRGGIQGWWVMQGGRGSHQRSQRDSGQILGPYAAVPLCKVGITTGFGAVKRGDPGRVLRVAMAPMSLSLVHVSWQAKDSILTQVMFQIPWVRWTNPLATFPWTQTEGCQRSSQSCPQVLEKWFIALTSPVNNQLPVLLWCNPI